MTDDETVPGTLVESAATLPVATAEPAGAMVERYTLGPLLGRGGMGEVVSAKDEQMGRDVAIKRMRATDDPGTVARFLREARIQGRLDHPAIVPVHELGKDPSGAPYFVMKRLAGVTLAAVIEALATGAPTTHTRTSLLRAFVDVCLAVELAHTRGIVHRDLKPANIVLGTFGEVFVLDWGIAKVVDDPHNAFREVTTLDDGQTSAGAILGTPGYMAPEQIEAAEDLDGRADVYALGCILFEILALEPLHPRGREGLAAALVEVDGGPATRGRDVPPELDTICRRAIRVERSARFATARELGDAVQAYLDGDRDIAMRNEIARAALAEARSHLERDPSDVAGVAMRAVGRAVALDPANQEAAQLLSKLMIEALPSEPPASVAAELADADVQNQLATRRLTAVAGYGYLGALPVLFWIGFPAWQLGLVAAIAAAMIVVGWKVDARNVMGMSRLAVVIHMATIVLATQLASPLLLAPMMALVIAMSNSTLTNFARPLTMAGLFIAAVMVPFALEQLGVIAPSVIVAGDRIVLMLGVDRANPTATIVGLTLFVTGAIIFGSVLAGRMVDQRRTALAHTKMTAWRLRQLVAPVTPRG